MVHRYQPSIVGISEPFINLSALKSSFWHSLKMFPAAVNDRGDQPPNIWLLCDQAVQPTVLLATDQQLTVSCTLDTVKCVITWVYAKTTVPDRRLLWRDLLQVKNTFVQGPWIVLGDFNCVLGAHEKRGGLLPSAISCSEFQDMSTNCELIHLPTKGLPYTWTNKRGVSANVEMRLDRCLSNFSWIDVWRKLECSTLPRCSSDHSPLLVSFSRLMLIQRPPFRFQRMWLDHPSFLSLVTDVWQSAQFFGNPMFVLASKLRTLKQRFRAWNKTEFGDVNKMVENSFLDLDRIQQEIASLGPSDDRLSQESVASAQVHMALAHQERFYCDKSRIKWLSEGDRNTSFFHAMVKVRQLKHSLSVLRDGSRVIDDPKEISDHVINYFSDLFTADSSVIDTGLVSQVIPKIVTNEENAQLTAIPTSEEIFQVMCSMDHNSSPGPDGFGGVFYMKCWSIVGEDVIQAVQSFFTHGYILPHFNSNLMILIPKVPGADSVTQLRPIAMANFVFKLITKIIADRLGCIAARIISPNQSAFLKGRTIADPIILTSECINLLDHKCKGGNIAIKFDVQKAFDTLDWRFLIRVLKAFGFSDPFADWIKAILNSAHLSILINGATEGFFSCSRGVRQGDPLSPILFCLAEEVLSRGLTKLAEDGRTDLMSAPLGITPPSHVLFADDIMVFMRGTKRSLRNLMLFMEEYGLNSGQRINRAKSLVFLGKYASRRRFIIRKFLGVKQGSLPFTYLGVPIFQGRPKKLYFQAIADRVRCKLASWKGSLLSQAGRIQLIQSVIQGILVYSFQIYEWPTCLLRDLQSCIRNFFWTGDPLKRGMPLLAWRICCKPKVEGGLGLRDLFEANRALLIKRCWEVLSSSSPASILVRTRFLNEDFQPLKSFKKSSVWLGLKKVWPTFFNSLQWCVGNGRKISFWFDNWLGEPLASTIGVAGAIPLQAKLHEFIVDSNWVLPEDFIASFPQVAGKIKQIALPVEDTTDSLLWPGSSSGVLTAKEAFTFFSSHIDRRNWGQVIWNKAIQPRKSLVVWKALHGRLLTDDALQRRGFSLPSCCSFCGSHAESYTHLLLHCPQIVPLWKWICLLFSHSFSPWNTLEEVFFGDFASTLSKHKRQLWFLVIGNLIWYIWITRNLLRFEAKVFDVLDAQRQLLELFKESAKLSFHPYKKHTIASIYSILGISQLSAAAASFIPSFHSLELVSLYHPP
ncbi:uncharacterized protein LOC133730332 [Rosa rugosa]|uniref:uncharacterized protein LOC133730332 n=1 Tax=Rosa rugosa TaxID=74645 RepID=UPI002B40AF1D|nr:uncharacterized protein LOC133730332 [Rosa rugosa]